MSILQSVLWRTGKSPVNVKFEVPLYVTMAAKSGDAAMTMPDGYDISNAAAPELIPMTSALSMKIQALGDWKIVSTGTPLNSLTEMVFSIGGCEMPAVSEGRRWKNVTCPEPL